MELRQPHDRGLLAVQLELGLRRAADDLIGRDPVHLGREGANELDAAARNDEDLEAVGPQIVEHLEHRLVHELIERPLVAWMARGREPLIDEAAELLRRRSRMRGEDDLGYLVHADPAEGLAIVLEDRLERLLPAPFGMLRGHRTDAIDREEELEVHGLLGPQRAVVVEGGDPIGLGHEVRAFRISHALDELHDSGPASRRHSTKAGDRPPATTPPAPVRPGRRKRPRAGARRRDC